VDIDATRSFCARISSAWAASLVSISDTWADTDFRLLDRSDTLYDIVLTVSRRSGGIC
jgi:hypothetical protein